MQEGGETEAPLKTWPPEKAQGIEEARKGIGGCWGGEQKLGGARRAGSKSGC